jgi:hypothetical protein
MTERRINPRPWKDLNPGRWIFVDLPAGTTPQQLIDLIESRTGVLIDQNAVSFKTTISGTWRFVISVSDDVIAGLLDWGLSEDQIGMMQLHFSHGKDR